MARRKEKGKNDDLVAAALDCSDSIRAAYKAHAQHKPLIEFNIQEQRLYACSYLEYRATLSERSQTMLTEQYEKAQLQNQIIVFVKDEKSRRLTSFSIDCE